MLDVYMLHQFCTKLQNYVILHLRHWAYEATSCNRKLDLFADIIWTDAVMVFVQINNPDMRVVILKDYAKEHFPSTPLIDYAIQVEQITTSKVCLVA